MDNAQKAIMIGVGLFITIIIISAVLLIVNLGTGLVDDATSELGTMSTSLQNQILQSYDNKVLSGVQVRSAIQQYMTASDMTVVLMKNTGTSAAPEYSLAATVGAKQLAGSGLTKKGEYYEVDGDEYKTPSGKKAGDTGASVDNITHRTSMNDFNSISNAASGVYINTSRNYKSYVLKVEKTDTIVGIVFEPEA